jgi:hypothetical protein
MGDLVVDGDDISVDLKETAFASLRMGTSGRGAVLVLGGKFVQRLSASLGVTCV